MRPVTFSALLCGIAVAAAGCGTQDDVTVVAVTNNPSPAPTVVVSNLAAVPVPGDLEGTITYKGKAPVPGAAPGFVAKDKFCTANKAKIKDQSLIVGPKGGIANVIVFLVRKPRGFKAPAPPKKPVVFDQKFCAFTPRVVLMRTGQPVEIRNSDDTTHNTHTLPFNNDGYNKSLASGKKDTISYAEAEPIPVKVVCDIHPWMMAYHMPLDHPFSAVTNKNGKFVIKGLPVGTHKVNIWHEKSGWLARNKTISIRPRKSTSLNLEVEPKAFSQFRGSQPKVVVLNQR